VIDADRRTLHVRCGSDIRDLLRAGGFGGDLLEYSDPVCEGPVPAGPDLIAVRARFLADAYGWFKGLSEAQFAAGLQQAEEQVATAHRYARVVLWFEHDSYDQLILARCLSRLAAGPMPACLELICIDRHPSIARFVGLGQLQPEALAGLWPARRAVTPGQIALGQAIWAALRAPEPLGLEAIAATATPVLPFAAPALCRHLRELPGLVDGLSMTQRIALQILSGGPMPIGQMFGALMQGREPLPFLGDLMFLRIVEQMAPRVLTLAGPEQPYARMASITEIGRQVLEGVADYLSLGPPERWVGGVIADGRWRWDDGTGSVARASPPASRSR
jgi:hypothetical protein